MCSGSAGHAWTVYRVRVRRRCNLHRKLWVCMLEKEKEGLEWRIAWQRQLCKHPHTLSGDDYIIWLGWTHSSMSHLFSLFIVVNFVLDRLMDSLTTRIPLCVDVFWELVCVPRFHGHEAVFVFHVRFIAVNGLHPIQSHSTQCRLVDSITEIQSHLSL